VRVFPKREIVDQWDLLRHHASKLVARIFSCGLICI